MRANGGVQKPARGAESLKIKYRCLKAERGLKAVRGLKINWRGLKAERGLKTGLRAVHY